MNRRNFLQALGIGGSATALSACGLDNNRYYTPIESVIPYVNRPDQLVPGTPTFFATSVLTGPNAFPALAINREGRVVNVGANHKTPAPAGVSRYAFFEVQRHYSPDRYRGPMAAGQAVAWDAALGQLADAVKAAKAAGKKVAYLGGYKGPTLTKTLHAFTGGEAVFWEPLGREAEAKASELVFGRRLLPRYDLTNARYVLSFGADFLGGMWGGQWTQGEFAKAKSPEGGFVARLGLVSAHRDQSGVNADDWYACLPGSEVQVARAIAKLVAEKKGYSGPAMAWLDGADAASAATAAGLDAAALDAIATAFAAGESVALPGGISAPNATELAVAVYLINIVANAPGFGLGGFQGPVHGADRVEALLADLKAGKVGVLLVDDVVNPAWSLPADAGVAEAFGKVDLLVSVSSHPDETAALAKLVLPTNDAFEDWGDEEPVLGFHIVRQPAAMPLWDSKSLGDVVLHAWRAFDPAAPQGTWREVVQARWLAEVRPGAAPVAAPAPVDPAAAPVDPAAAPAPAPAPAPAAAPSAEAQRWWESALSNGYFAGPMFGQRVEPAISGAAIAWTAAAFTGSGEYFLHVFAHAFLADGRYSNQPWAQEVPDPLTGHVWDSWVLVHPDTAAKLGVKDGDLLTLTAEKGQLQVGVEISPAMRPEVLAVPFGNGHGDAAGRYAKAGVNVASALGMVKDSQGCMAWQQAKVAAASAGAKSDVWSTFGGDSDNDRKFVGLVSAEQLAAKGDEVTVETRFAGEMLLDSHEAPWDDRLTQAGITDFYGMPDHPHYRWGMSIDTNACTGCGACAVACYAENNIPVVGKVKVREGREMGWLRLNRYWKPERDDEGNLTDKMSAYFVPMMCQHCAHAPCESVCPVLATYHTIEGLNAMVYNRCVGTRYCSNACPFSIRRFNYHSYQWPEPFNLMLNPDVSTRTMGVMEKCTFCIQRLRRTKIVWKDQGHKDLVPDEHLTRITACADACPSNAITFGNLKVEESAVSKLRKSARAYYPLPEVNVFPAVHYLGRASFHRKPPVHHGGGHGGEAGGEGGHGDAAGAEHGNTEHAPAAEPAAH